MIGTVAHVILARAIYTVNFAGPIVTLYLYNRGLSLEQVMWLATINMISWLVFELPTGVISDRWGRKWSLVAGSLAGAVAWAVWLFSDSFFAFAIAHILFGLASALWSGADEALIIDELHRTNQQDKTQKIFARYGSMMTGMYGVGALIGGFIAREHTAHNFQTLFFLTAGSSVVAALVALFIREHRHTKLGDEVAHEQETMFSRFTVGLRVLRAQKKLRKIAWFYSCVSLLSFTLMTLYQIYFKQSGVPDAWFGPALAISCVCVALVKWHSHRIEKMFGAERGLMLTILIPVFLWTLMAIIIHPIAAVVLFIAADAAQNMSDPMIADYQNRHIDSAHRATVLSTISLICSLFLAIFGPLIGAVADYNFSLALIGVAIFVIVGTMLFRVTAEDVTA